MNIPDLFRCRRPGLKGLVSISRSSSRDGSLRFVRFPLLGLAVAVSLLQLAPCFAQSPAPPIRLGEPVPPANPPVPPANPPLPPGPAPAPVNPIPSLQSPPAVPGQVIVPGGIVEPRPARVGEVIIAVDPAPGAPAPVTKDFVIRRQIPLEPGQILSFPDLRVAERNLAGLGIFIVDPTTGVRPVVTADPDGDSEIKNIFVRVQEARTTAFLFGVSVNSDAGLNGSVVFNERNFDITGWPSSWEDFRTGRAFRGAGQELRLEATPGTQEQRYVATFREPFLFDSLFSFTASGYYYQSDFPDEYTESRLGMRLTLGRRLDREWSIDGTLRVEDVGVHSLPLDPPIEIVRDEGNHALVGFRIGATYDTRDSIIRATDGLMANLSFEEVTGDFTFPKLILGANKYWTVAQRPDGSGRQVLALRSELGYAGSQTPVFEHFYAGGFRSLRGFAFRGAGPNDRGVEIGGDFEFLNSLEYQVPILANDRLFGVAFVDSGTVESSVEIHDYRVAVGGGVRILIPQLSLVPIALDVAVPVAKAHGDHTQVFSFWIGFSR
jgi:outer membrane protein insertion porin family